MRLFDREIEGQRKAIAAAEDRLQKLIGDDALRKAAPDDHARQVDEATESYVAELDRLQKLIKRANEVTERRRAAMIDLENFEDTKTPRKPASRRHVAAPIGAGEVLRPTFLVGKAYDLGDQNAIQPLRPQTSQSVDINKELLATTLRRRSEEHQ